jgi:hypothetical protein
LSFARIKRLSGSFRFPDSLLIFPFDWPREGAVRSVLVD